MALDKVDVDVIRNIFTKHRKIDYNDQFSIMAYIPDANQYNHFERLCKDGSESQFEQICGFPKSELMLYGDNKINFHKYDSDPEYKKDIDFYLNLVIPSIKVNGSIKYACYSVVRSGKPIMFAEPTLLSAFNCFLSLLNNPAYTIVRRTKNN